MNESIPLATPVEPTVPAYKDRSTGLVVFGILTLLMGGLCALFVPLMLLGQVVAARANPASVNLAAMLPGMIRLWCPGGGAGLAGHRFHHGPALGAGAPAHLFLELAGDGHHHAGGHGVRHAQGIREPAVQPERRTSRRCLRGRWAWRWSSCSCSSESFLSWCRRSGLFSITAAM